MIDAYEFCQLCKDFQVNEENLEDVLDFAEQCEAVEKKFSLMIESN